jgi:hypothetical protein
MLGREYEPEVTSSFYLAATTSEEGRRVEVASLSRSIEL